MNVFGKIHALNLRAIEILKNRLSSGVCKDGGYEGRKSFCYCRRKGRKRTGKRAVSGALIMSEEGLIKNIDSLRKR